MSQNADIQLTVFLSVYPLKVILGISVFISNFVIFVVFLTKSQRSSTDYLIMPNLFSDSFYGLQMCIPYYIFGDNFMFVRSFIEQIFIFFSLIMLFLMTIERYAAVLRPRRFRTWFSTRNVILFLGGLAISTMVTFIVLFHFLYLRDFFDANYQKNCEYYQQSANSSEENCSLDRNKAEKAQFGVKTFVYYIWPQFQLILVLFNTTLTIVVYRMISKHFNQSFVSGFFRRLTNQLGRLIENENLPNFRSSSRVNTLETSFGSEQIRSSAESLATLDESVFVEPDSDNRRVDSNVSQFSMESSNGIKSATTSSEITDNQSIPTTNKKTRTTGDNNAKSHVNRKNDTLQKREQAEKKLTLTFFFTACFFILVAVPTSIFNSVGLWHLLIVGKRSDVFRIGIWVSQTFYGFVFLLNPYVYASSNRSVRRKLKSIYRRIKGKNCFCAKQEQKTAESAQ